MSLSKERLGLCAATTHRVRNADEADAIEARTEEALRLWYEWGRADASVSYSALGPSQRRREVRMFGLPHAATPQPLTCGLKVRLGSFWIGAHWSPQNKRLCINLIPCVTLWVVFPGGVKP